MSVRSDAELARAWQAGDRSAFSDVYDQLGAVMYAVAMGLVRDPAAACDVVVDTFERASQQLDGLGEPDRLRAWLFGILRHQAAEGNHGQPRHDAGDIAVGDHSPGDNGLADHRSGDNGPGDHRSGDHGPGDVPAWDDEARADLPHGPSDPSASHLTQAVWSAAGALHRRDREVLELQVRAGLGTGDLADALGVTPGHAAVLLSRTRSRMEQAIGAVLIARLHPRPCAALDGELGTWDGRVTSEILAQVTRHVESCPACAQERLQLASRTRLTAAILPTFAVPDQLRRRVLTAVDPASRQLQLTPAGSGTTSGPDTVVVPAPAAMPPARLPLTAMPPAAMSPAPPPAPPPAPLPAPAEPGAATDTPPWLTPTQQFARVPSAPPTAPRASPPTLLPPNPQLPPTLPPSPQLPPTLLPPTLPPNPQLPPTLLPPTLLPSPQLPAAGPRDDGPRRGTPTALLVGAVVVVLLAAVGVVWKVVLGPSSSSTAVVSPGASGTGGAAATIAPTQAPAALTTSRPPAPTSNLASAAATALASSAPTTPTTSPTSTTAAAARLIVEPVTVSVGAGASGTQTRSSLTLANRGGQTLDWTGVVSGSGITLVPRSGSLAAGRSVRLKVTVVRGTAEGPLTDGIDITAAPTGQRFHVSVSGSVNNPPVISGVDPPQSVCQGQSAIWTVKATDDSPSLQVTARWQDGGATRTTAMPGSPTSGFIAKLGPFTALGTAKVTIVAVDRYGNSSAAAAAPAPVVSCSN